GALLSGDLFGVARDDLPELTAGISFPPSGDLPPCGSLDAFCAVSNGHGAAPPAETLAGDSDAGGLPRLFDQLAPYFGWRAITGAACMMAVVLASVVFFQAEQIRALKHSAGGRQSAQSPARSDHQRLSSALYV